MQVAQLVVGRGTRSRRTIRARAAKTSQPTRRAIMQDMPPLPELSINDLIVALNVAVYHSRPGGKTISLNSGAQ